MFSLFILVISISFFSFPANATSVSFSFVEFNIAFVLGLSLPILLMIFIVKPRPVIKKRLPVLLTLMLLGLLYSLNFQPQEHVILSLIFSSFILQLTSYWASHYLVADTKLNFKPVLKNTVFILTLTLFAGLLMSAIVNVKVAWLIFAGLQLFIALGFVWLLRKNSKESTARSISLLVINIIFSAGVYLWLDKQLSVNLLVIASVITYLLAMANGCWHLVTTLITREHDHHALLAKTSIQTAFDPATNLPNYQYALSAFQAQLKSNAEARYAVIVFKPINFQQVNGVLGHHNSDILLLQLAYCLQQSIAAKTELLNFAEEKSPVRLARLQGLHFLVVMDVDQSKHSDEVIIEQLCKELALAVPGPMSFKSFSSFFKLAFGVAFVGQDSANVSEVIACAEDALLQAEKQQNLLSFFNPELTVFNQQQLQKMEQLSRAIQLDNLQWRLQPQVKLDNKSISGFEMQVTWQREEDDLLTFTDIMAIAEQSGDAFELSRKIIQHALMTLVELKRLNMPKQVAIKLSENCLLEPDLVDYIEQQAVKHGIDCQFLLVEVKESILLMSAPQAKSSIDQLKSLGVQIVIDEFSGSYEALRYIRRMAISMIKIDCGLLAKAEAGSSDKAIINALITLTRKMELPLIGTNINVQASEEMFIAMGGEFGQGLRYNEGISLEELPHWIKAWQTQYPELD